MTVMTKAINTRLQSLVCLNEISGFHALQCGWLLSIQVVIFVRIHHEFGNWSPN